MATAKQLREKALDWEKRGKKWEAELAARPDDRMTQLSAKAIMGMANDQSAKLRAEASSLIGKRK